jgi:hypothetical protein
LAGRASVVEDRENLALAATSARRGGTGEIRIGRNKAKHAIPFSYFRGAQLESCVALAANVVETTFRLAGIKHFAR